MRGCNTRALSKEAPVSLVPSFLDLLQPLSCVMTTPTFDTFLTVITGWIFARRRTVTGMILAADAVGSKHGKHHSAYHRLFAAARWSLDELGLAVFALIPPLLNGMILLGIDDTLARKRGLKVFGVGMHHDPLLSTRKTAITNWGHCWVILGVILKPPFCGERWFCLPILFRLYVPKKTADKKGLPYHTKPQLAVQMLELLCGRCQNRQFHAIGDSTYGGKSVLLHLPANCGLTSRLAMDARRYEAPVNRKSRKGGRPRKRGVRLPTPEAMLAGRCRHLTLDIYGRKDTSRVAQCVARCYADPNRPLKVVAVEPLSGGRKPQAFFSTCADDTVEAVLTRYAARWSLEVTNHDAKGQLGFEEPQGWTKRAVQRTAPTAMLLYSLVALWFSREGHRSYQPPRRPWYIGKTQASFADMLSTLRCQSVKREVSSMHLHGRGRRNVIKTLMHAVNQAA
jgi:DDE superfamily endonuclease